MASDRKGFDAALKRAAQKLFDVKNKKAKLISNLDADGITAASIISKMLERLGFSFSTRILHQLKEENVEELSRENYEAFIFCDLGSGQLEAINHKFKDKIVIILDHHEVQGIAGDNITHVNPHLFGFDGSVEISAAGVCFFFARIVDEKNDDLAHLAVIGAIGDVQESNGFIGLYNEILSIAVKKGPRLYGLQTRPLIKLLEYGSDLEIPGVTGDRFGTIDFLKEVDLNNGHTHWTTYHELEEDDKQKLVERIIFRRKISDIPNAEDVLTNVYVVEGEKGVFSDAKEYSTMLNSCGRMNNAHIGIGVCLKNDDERKEALKILKNYKLEIVNSINWFNKELRDDNSNFVIRGKNYVIINAKKKIKATIIGTLASIISKGNVLDNNIFVLSMARNKDDTTKISLRISNNPDSVDLKEIVSNVIEKTGGEAGGHQYAAGAVIDTKQEKCFIEEAKTLFEKQDF